jgi:hypothetical protein
MSYFKQHRAEWSLGNAELQAREFVDSFKRSGLTIDEFLAGNPDFMKMGIYAILFRIFNAEINSKFREDVEKPEHDWYLYLFRRMKQGLLKPDACRDFHKNDVSFITFNYDRSLEHFLYDSLFHSFREIDHAETKRQICALNIVHVFGKVAALDWQDPDSEQGSDNRVAYGKRANDIKIPSLLNNLRIIYDERENPPLDQAKKLIREAKRIYFLGFGYRPENIELLDFPTILEKQGVTSCPPTYGTALNLTKQEKATAKARIGRQLHFFSEPTDCLLLLRSAPSVC